MTSEKPNESKTRTAAELVVTVGLKLIPVAEERTFAAIAKATLEAAQVLDSLPDTKQQGSRADEVKRRRDERAAAARTDARTRGRVQSGDGAGGA